MNEKPSGYSLRFRLLAGGAVSVVLALAVAGLVLSGLFQTHLRLRFERELAGVLDQLAGGLGLTASGQLEVQRPPADPRFQRPLSGLYWQVMADGTAPLRSRSLWDGVLDLPRDTLDDGGLHRHASRGPDGAAVIVVERSVQIEGRAGRLRLAAAESRAALDQAQHEFDTTLALSLVVLALVLTLAAAAQVGIGLRPLAQLRRELADIRHGRRASFDSAVPVEVKPLVDDLNHLLAHSAEVVERARVQTGNLAHALKTGLAVIANDANGMANGTGGLDGAAAARLQDRVGTMLHQINHHLSRARAAAARGLLGWRTEVAPVVAALKRTLASLHAGRDLVIEVVGAEGLLFAGDREDLEEMLGNLMDNACKWARTRVRVGAEREMGQLVFRVEDDGSGLPEGVAHAIPPRGVRLDESVPGSGLGLGIVRDLCELYGGALELDRSPLGGARARLTLPLAGEEPAGD